MLKVRVIPTLLWKDIGLVKGISFNSWRRIGSVLPAVKVFNTRQVDELIILNITASQHNAAPDYEMIEEISSECFVPLTVGGGIKSLDEIKNLLRSGADKISINSTAFNNPELIGKASEKFGSQCIVVSIDAKQESDGDYYCYSHSGNMNTGKKVIDWAKAMEKLGAGEILLCDIVRDGTMTGYNYELIKRVTDSVSIPVIASGGAGNYEHCYQAISLGKASAVSVSSIFQFTEQTPLEVKDYLKEHNIPVRNINIK